MGHTVPKLSTEAPVVSALQATLLALQATLLVLQDILLGLSMLSTEAQAASVQLASLVRLGSALQDSALLPARTSLLLHLPRQPRPTKFCQMSDHRAQAYHFCDVPRLNETRL